METKPLITVITVCYNSAATIRDTIDSVLQQDFDQPFEYLLVDGGSTDATIDIIKSYIPLFEEKGITYRFNSGRDNGIYDAMNKGIAMAAGELIGILNSDDWYESHTLRLMWEAYGKAEDKVHTLFYGIIRIWRDGKEYAVRQHHHNFVTENVIQHPTCFVPAALYKEYGGFSNDYRLAADFELLNRLNSKGVTFYKLDAILTNFRMGGASSSRARMVEMETFRVKKTYGTISTNSYRKILVKYHIKNMLRKLLPV